MKSARTILLGSAAAVITAASAHAADMPVKAKPVQYVKICTLYGDGFYYIPGSDTCIKIGGYASLDVGWNLNNGGTLPSSATILGASQGQQDRTVHAFSTRARAVISMDSRTQTEYGTLRTLTFVQFQNQDQVESLNLVRAFIQWAGFSFGHMDSFSDTWGIYDPYKISSPRTSNDTFNTGVNSIDYTWELGNGVNFTVGADERRIKPIANLSVNSSLVVGNDPTDFHQGEKMPDLVAAFHFNGPGINYAGISAELHDVNAGYYTDGTATAPTSGIPGYSCTAVGQGGGLGPANASLTTCGHPSDKLGWVVNAGGDFKADMLNKGDRWGVRVTYSQGMAAAGGGGSTSSPGLFGGGNNAALGFVSEGVFTNGSQIELTTVWSVNAAYLHQFTPALSGTVFVGYEQYLYDGQATSYFSDAMGCTANGAVTGAARQAAFNLNAGSTTANCSPNFALLETGIGAKYKVRPDFYFAVEASYTYISTAFKGSQVNLTSATGTNPLIGGARPAGIYTAGDQGIFSFQARVRKDFNSTYN